MKTTAIYCLCLLFSAFVYSQDYTTFGYRTTDIGGSFEWYPSGTVYGLHAAFNSRQHHSIHFKLGYNITNRKEGEVNDIEKGNGWGGTLGYRYYFKPFPHKFFIGARSDVWRKSIDWTKAGQNGTTNTWTLVPAFEIGYTFWINDQAFLTPSISNGAEINLKTDGQKVGQGFITIIGVSTGVRL